MTKTVLYEERGDLALITIDREHRLNALTDEVLDDLAQAWSRYSAGHQRCAVLSATGERAFCAGADLQSPPRDVWRGVPGVGVSLNKPVIGAVFGHVVGAGVVLTQYCDLVVAASDTVFRYPEVNVGFTGGLAAGWVTRVHHKAAMEMLLLGHPIEALRAESLGMVNRVVSPGRQLEVAYEWGEQIARSAPLVVALLKELAEQSLPTTPVERYAAVSAQLDRVSSSRDASEGIAAMIQHRPAEFLGR